MNLTEQLADAARRWAQAKQKAAEAEQEMLDLANGATTEVEMMTTDARIERRRNAIRMVREQRGWSQQKLGIALGFKPGPSQARVSQIEHGYRMLTPYLFERVAKVFGMTPAELEATFSTTPRSQNSSRKQRIIEVLRRANGPQTIGVIADRSDCTTSDAYADIVDLVNDGLVVKADGGYILKEQLGAKRPEAA